MNESEYMELLIRLFFYQLLKLVSLTAMVVITSFAAHIPCFLDLMPGAFV